MQARLLKSILAFLGTCALAAAQPAGSAGIELRARAAGHISKIHVKTGASVKRGDLLIELDRRVQVAELERAEAQIKAAQAQLKQANAEAERAKRLYEGKAISREEYEKTLTNRAQAEAEFQAASANAQIARVMIEYTSIHAPQDGILGRLLLAEGEQVKAGDLLVLLAPAGPLQKPSNKLKELLQERRDVLSKTVELLTIRYRAGTASAQALIDAQRAALQANLELVETPAERADLLRKDLKLIEEILGNAQKRFEAGQTTEIEVLGIRAVALEARIQLQRALDQADAKK